MIDCFIDIIGLQYCGPGSSTPASGIYINSLPGISIRSLDGIAEEEQKNFLGLWNDVQTSALAQFRLDIIMEMNKCYELSKTCDYDALICENVDELTLAWKYLLGSWIQVFALTSERVSRYTTNNRDEANELKAFYDTEYQKALKIGVQLMNTESCCLSCGGNPETVTWLP